MTLVNFNYYHQMGSAESTSAIRRHLSAGCDRETDGPCRGVPSRVAMYPTVPVPGYPEQCSNLFDLS